MIILNIIVYLKYKIKFIYKRIMLVFFQNYSKIQLIYYNINNKSIEINSLITQNYFIKILGIFLIT